MEKKCELRQRRWVGHQILFIFSGFQDVLTCLDNLKNLESSLIETGHHIFSVKKLHFGIARKIVWFSLRVNWFLRLFRYFYIFCSSLNGSRKLLNEKRLSIDKRKIGTSGTQRTVRRFSFGTALNATPMGRPIFLTSDWNRETAWWMQCKWYGGRLTISASAEAAARFDDAKKKRGHLMVDLKWDTGFPGRFLRRPLNSMAANCYPPIRRGSVFYPFTSVPSPIGRRVYWISPILPRFTGWIFIFFHFF